MTGRGLRRNEVTMWKYYAVLSAVFAAATAIFAKLGLKNVDSNLATAIRTTVILMLAWSVVLIGGGVSLHIFSYQLSYVRLVTEDIIKQFLVLVREILRCPGIQLVKISVNVAAINGFEPFRII